jgi:hypothetical protein
MYRVDKICSINVLPVLYERGAAGFGFGRNLPQNQPPPKTRSAFVASL